jgi:hypothetical protein
MLFALPIIYQVTGVKRGNSRATSCQVVEMVEVDIPVVAPSDAPIAVEWIAYLPDHFRERGPAGNFSSAFSPTPPDGNLHTRFFAGGHYCPLVGSDVSAGIGPLVNPDVLEATKGFGIWGDPFGLGRMNPFSLDALAEPRALVLKDTIEETFERVERTNRADVVAKLRKTATKLAFVGDCLYRECSEPQIIVAKTHARGADGVWKGGIIPFVTCEPDRAWKCLNSEKIDTYGIYDLSDWMRLEAKAQKENRHREIFDPMYIGRAPAICEVMSDSHYKLTGEIRQAAERFIVRAGEHRLDEMTTPVIMAYCGVVDAFRRLTDPNGMDNLDIAVASFVEVANDGNTREASMAVAIARLSELLEGRTVELASVVLYPER